MYKTKQGTGLKILTPTQMLQRLPTALAQVKAGNNSEKVWHPHTEPKYSRARFVKRLRPAEKFIFQIMQLL